ncbi:unnamed protein product, partial [Leptidea sinapis]
MIWTVNLIFISILFIGVSSIENCPDCIKFNSCRYSSSLFDPETKTITEKGKRLFKIATCDRLNNKIYQNLVGFVSVIITIKTIFFTENVAPICLPIYAYLRRKALLGHNGIVAGWGITDTFFRSSILRKHGIVYRGPNMCGLVRAGIYTDVAKYMDWILAKINK